MNTEREIYITALKDLLATKDLKMATNLQKEWSQNIKGRNLAAAVCYYMTNFVIPTLVNNQRTIGDVPRWVDEILLRPPEEPTNIISFLHLFDSKHVEALSERKRGGSQILVHTQISDEVEKMKEGNMGLYFTPNPIDGKKISKNGSIRLDENVKRFSACFADFDGGDKMNQMLRIELYCPTPTLIVESKNGYWPFWLLEDGVTEQEWRMLMNGVIKTCDSDKAVRNPSRLARLPFTWHCKTDDKFFCRIAAFNWKRYTKDELAEAFNVDFNPVVKPLNYSGHQNLIAPRGLKPPQPAILSPGSRHATLVTEAGRIYAHLDLSKAGDARALMLEWFSRSMAPLKPRWEKEVNAVCNFFEEKEFGTIISG